MSDRTLLLLLVVLCLTFNASIVHAFSSGAVIAKGPVLMQSLYCGRKPLHRAPFHVNAKCGGFCHASLDTSDKYRVAVSEDVYWDSEINVTLSTVEDSPYRLTGFAISAVNDEGTVVGTFTETDDVTVVTCNSRMDVEGTTALHTQANHSRTNITLKWTGPEQNFNDLKFRIWLVHSHETIFYLESSPLRSRHDGRSTMNLKSVLIKLLGSKAPAKAMDAFENSFKLRHKLGYSVNKEDPFEKLRKLPRPSHLIPRAGAGGLSDAVTNGPPGAGGDTLAETKTGGLSDAVTSGPPDAGGDTLAETETGGHPDAGTGGLPNAGTDSPPTPVTDGVADTDTGGLPDTSPDSSDADPAALSALGGEGALLTTAQPPSDETQPASPQAGTDSPSSQPSPNDAGTDKPTVRALFQEANPTSRQEGNSPIIIQGPAPRRRTPLPSQFPGGNNAAFPSNGFPQQQQQQQSPFGFGGSSPQSRGFPNTGGQQPGVGASPFGTPQSGSSPFGNPPQSTFPSFGNSPQPFGNSQSGAQSFGASPFGASPLGNARPSVPFANTQSSSQPPNPFGAAPFGNIQSQSPFGSASSFGAPFGGVRAGQSGVAASPFGIQSPLGGATRPVGTSLFSGAPLPPGNSSATRPFQLGGAIPQPGSSFPSALAPRSSPVPSSSSPFGSPFGNSNGLAGSNNFLQPSAPFQSSNPFSSSPNGLGGGLGAMPQGSQLGFPAYPGFGGNRGRNANSGAGFAASPFGSSPFANAGNSFGSRSSFGGMSGSGFAGGGGGSFGQSPFTSSSSGFGRNSRFGSPFDQSSFNPFFGGRSGFGSVGGRSSGSSSSSSPYVNYMRNMMMGGNSMSSFFSPMSGLGGGFGFGSMLGGGFGGSFGGSGGGIQPGMSFSSTRRG